VQPGAERDLVVGDAAALMMTGNPICRAVSSALSSFSIFPLEPGNVGTLCLEASCLQATLSPSFCMDSTLGPMNSMLQDRQTSAKWLFSERNP